MQSWLYLMGAVIAEVTATTALKESEGFTNLWPSVVVVIGYGVAFGLLGQTLKTMSVGVAYAVWAGLGIALISIVGWLRFGQKLDASALAGVGLIVAGILVMNLFSESVHA